MSGKKRVCIGVDFGTTYTKVALQGGVDKRKDVVKFGKESSFPSIVAFDDDGRVLVGHDAANRSEYFSDSKRLIGNSQEELDRYKTDYVDSAMKVERKNDGFIYMSLGDRQVRAVDIGKHILEYVKGVLENEYEIIRICVTYPARFADHQIESLMNIAKSVFGDEKTVFLREPIAAAFYYAVDEAGGGGDLDNTSLIVYDLGGGTFDITSIFYDRVRREIDVSSYDGDINLGGRNIDIGLYELICNSEPELRNLDGKDKIMLNNEIRKYKEEVFGRLDLNGRSCRINNFVFKTSGKEYKVTLQHEDVQSILEDVFGKTRDLLNKFTRDNDGAFLVTVGGTSNVRYIKDGVTMNAEEGSYFTSAQGQLAVCKGGAYYAAIKAGIHNDIRVKDKVPRNYGFQLDNGEIVIVVPRGSYIPISKQPNESFRPSGNSVRIHVPIWSVEDAERYKKDPGDVRNRRRLGCILHEVPSGVDITSYRLDVKFSMSHDSPILKCSTIDSNGVHTDVELDYGAYSNSTEVCQHLSSGIYDIVFVCDATSSMEAWVEGISNIFGDVFRTCRDQGLDVNFGAVFYRDTAQNPSDMVDVVKVSPPDVFASDLQSSAVEARSGGDDEDWVSAYEKVFSVDFGFRERSTRIIFHIADASAHGKAFGGKDDTPGEEAKLNSYIGELIAGNYYFRGIIINSKLTNGYKSAKTFTVVRNRYRDAGKSKFYGSHTYNTNHSADDFLRDVVTTEIAGLARL